MDQHNEHSYTRPDLYNTDLWERDCSGEVPTVPYPPSYPPGYPPSRPPIPPTTPPSTTIPVFTKASDTPFVISNQDDLFAMDIQRIDPLQDTFALFIPKGMRHFAFAIPASKEALVIIRESGMSNVTATIGPTGTVINVPDPDGVPVPYMVYSDDLPGFGYEGDIHYDITMS